MALRYSSPKHEIVLTGSDLVGIFITVLGLSLLAGLFVVEMFSL